MKYFNYLNRVIAIIRAIIFRLFFKKIGPGTALFSSLRIEGAENIIIGKKVNVASYCWLAALPLTGEKSCSLEFGDGCSIGHFNHIYATKKVKIGNNVLTADRVYISDNSHCYDNINIPIIFQKINQLSEVEIGDGTWLGENSCIIGVKIGKNCVIGCNSVVTKNVPDYCIAVGSPAKIIKKYCLQSKEWKKTDDKGNFI